MKILKNKYFIMMFVVQLLTLSTLLFSSRAFAQNTPPPPPNIDDAVETLEEHNRVKTTTVEGRYTCGSGSSAIKVSINIGCHGRGNAILDVFFSIIRFLSLGVGLVIVTSMIVAGIQYTASRGDPSAVAAAITRIRNNVIALLLYLFAYAILNWLMPSRLLQ